MYRTASDQAGRYPSMARSPATPGDRGGGDDTIPPVPRDLVAEMRQLRAQNEERIVALVRENPGLLSVDAAALRLQISPITIRSAVGRYSGPEWPD